MFSANPCRVILQEFKNMSPFLFPISVCLLFIKHFDCTMKISQPCNPFIDNLQVDIFGEVLAFAVVTVNITSLFKHDAYFLYCYNANISLTNTKLLI